MKGIETMKHVIDMHEGYPGDDHCWNFDHVECWNTPIFSLYHQCPIHQWTAIWKFLSNVGFQTESAKCQNNAIFQDFHQFHFWRHRGCHPSQNIQLLTTKRVFSMSLQTNPQSSQVATDIPNFTRRGAKYEQHFGNFASKTLHEKCVFLATLAWCGGS